MAQKPIKAPMPYTDMTIMMTVKAFIRFRASTSGFHLYFFVPILNVISDPFPCYTPLGGVSDMNLNYVAIIISIVSFAASIVSTVWVSHLNRKHEEKMFMLDFWVKHRAEVLERYVRYTGAFLAAERKYTALNDYLSSYGEALLYIPSESRQTADSLNHFLCDG